MTSKVVLTDIEPETMELLVGWLYGKVDKPLTLRQAADLFVASDRFDVPDLQQACVKIIAHRVEMLSPMLPQLLVYNLWQYATTIGSDAIVRVSTHSKAAFGICTYGAIQCKVAVGP